MFKTLRHIVKVLRVLRRASPLFFKGIPLKGGVRFFLWLMGVRAVQEGELDTIRLALRDDLVKLGAPYIKLGQLLATRPDIVGDKLAHNLSFLHDRLTPEPPEVIQALLHKVYPDRWPFETFSFETSDAASVAQVHQAVLAQPFGDLKAGQKVAVKVVRPGVQQTSQDIFRAFAFLSSLAVFLSKEARRLRLRHVVQELQDGLENELDMRLEASSMSVFLHHTQKNHLKKRAVFGAPHVCWPLVRSEVLVTSFVEEKKLSLYLEQNAEHQRSDITQDNLKDVDSFAASRGAFLASRLVKAFLVSVLFDGFFHADLHPGNIFVGPHDVLTLVDFGLMGSLDVKTRFFMGRILYGFVHRDYDLVTRAHFEIGYVPMSQDRQAFLQAMRYVGENVLNQSTGEISMARLLKELLQISRRFHMELQPQLVFLQKSMVIVEGVVGKLDPQHNLWNSSEPVLRAWARWSLRSPQLLKRLRDGAQEEIEAWRELRDILILEHRGSRSAKSRAPKFWSVLISLLCGVVLGGVCVWVYFLTLKP